MSKQSENKQTISEIATELDAMITDFLKQKNLEHTGSVSISIHGVPPSLIDNETTTVLRQGSGYSYLTWDLRRNNSLHLFSQYLYDNESNN